MSVIELGDSIPSLTPHVSLNPAFHTYSPFDVYCPHENKHANETQGTSVSLPAWLDNVEYEEGKERVLNKMTTGYPRYVLIGTSHF